MVAEYVPTGREPDGSEPARQAAYWVEVNSSRWREALALEQDGNRVVLCDSDPLKSIYSSCLSALGRGSAVAVRVRAGSGVGPLSPRAGSAWSTWY